MLGFKDLRIGMKVYINATGYGLLTVLKSGTAGFYTEKGYLNYNCSWIDWIKTASLNELSVQEQSQYTFDDLIDVAVQAYKDRVINGFTVVGEKLNCQTLDGEDYNLGIGCEVAHGIKYLQSLYKETFVIECEEDIKRVKSNAKVTLANNETFIAVDDYVNCGLNLVGCDYKGVRFALSLLALRGATVEQERTRND